MAKKKRKAKSKSKRSAAADRARVSGSQKHEVAYIARKHRVSAAVVRATIKKVGNSRKKIEASLARGKAADRARVSGKQAHEVAYLARKHGVSAATVRATIKKVGNSRKKVDAALAAR